MGFIWSNTTLISEEYHAPVKVPHGVVQCRFLDVLDFGVQLCTTYNERKSENYTKQEYLASIKNRDYSFFERLVGCNWKCDISIANTDGASLK